MIGKDAWMSKIKKKKKNKLGLSLVSSTKSLTHLYHNQFFWLTIANCRLKKISAEFDPQTKRVVDGLAGWVVLDKNFNEKPALD